MLQGGDGNLSANRVAWPFLTRVSEYSWRLFQFGSSSDLIGPVL
jgi:hypothetical protein